MTEDQLDHAVEGAIELLGGCDAMDPKLASQDESIEFLEAVSQWCRDSVRAIQDDQARGRGGDAD